MIDGGNASVGGHPNGMHPRTPTGTRRPPFAWKVLLRIDEGRQTEETVDMKRIRKGDWSAIAKGRLGAALTALNHHGGDVLAAAPEQARRMELAAAIPLLPTFGRRCRGWTEGGGLLAPAGRPEGLDWWDVRAPDDHAAFELCIGSERGWEQAARYDLELTSEGLRADLAVRNSVKEKRRSAIGQRFRVPAPGGSELKVLGDHAGGTSVLPLPMIGAVTVDSLVGGVSIARPDGSTTRIAVEGGARFELAVVNDVLIVTTFRTVVFEPSDSDVGSRRELRVHVGI